MEPWVEHPLEKEDSNSHKALRHKMPLLEGCCPRGFWELWFISIQGSGRVDLEEPAGGTWLRPPPNAGWGRGCTGFAFVEPPNSESPPSFLHCLNLDSCSNLSNVN